MRCLIILIAAVPSLAFAQSATPASTAAATIPAVPEKKICRREADTGTSIPETVCHTRSEWVAMENAHEKERRSEMGMNGYQARRGPNSN
jgi:hypothetical protein